MVGRVRRAWSALDPLSSVLLIERERLDPRTERLRPSPELSWRAVIRGWQDDDELCDAFTAALGACPFDAFFFETPPVSKKTRAAPFEHVLVASPRLASTKADPKAFAEHFGDAPTATFTNLGGDAVLVAPAPDGERASYGHFAAFLRGGPPAQIRALWRAVGRALDERLEAREEPCFLSTAGLGVLWLHVRLDDAPKYYTHAPYRVSR